MFVHQEQAYRRLHNWEILGGRPTRAFLGSHIKVQTCHSVYSGCYGMPESELIWEETGSHGPDREARSMPATQAATARSTQTFKALVSLELSSKEPFGPTNA